MYLRETSILLALLALAPVAAAQEPTVNESDYDTSPPGADESYLDEAANTSAPASTTGEPTLAEGDFNTATPTADESYLDEAESQVGGTPAPTASAPTPGPGLLVFVAALGLAGLLLRRR